MNNLENIVQIALSAYDIAWCDERPPTARDDFELELRRLLMQASYIKKEHTYTITPSNLMGTWNTTTGTRQCPPIIKTEILHG